MFIKSIRWRLQLWFAFLLTCILSSFVVTAYQLHRTNRMSQIDQELEHRVSVVSADLRGPARFGPGPPPPLGDGPPGRPFPGPPPFEDGLGPPPRGHRGPEPRSRPIQLSAETRALFNENEADGFYYAIWSRGGDLMKASSNVVADVTVPKQVGVDTAIHRRMRGPYREAFHFTELGDCILAGRPIGADLAEMRSFAWWLVGAGGIVLVLGLGGGSWLTSRAIRPIEQISGAATRISAGHLSERINVADTDSELGRLAGVLNSTFARLETAFAEQKQFTADASHELRTPLTVLICEAQTCLARERTASEYRETVQACLDTAKQMKRLTESLLELARFDAGQEVMERSPLDLGDLTRSGVELVTPLLKARKIRILCDLLPAKTMGDIDRLGQVVTNLLTNAIYYNKEQGEIRVSTRTEDQSTRLSISDTGVGIDSTEIPKLFKRFYRADKARSRANGRTGLGLAICKAIVEAHGGTIEVTSKAGAGSTFSITLPAGQPA